MSLPRFWLTVCAWMGVAAAVGLCIGGYFAAFREPPEVVEPVPWTTADHDVFDVVLTDLIVNKEFDAAVGPGGAARTQIVFADTTLRGIGRLGFSLETWARDKKVPKDLTTEFLRRNPVKTRYIFNRYRPSNPNILLRDLRLVDTDFTFAGQFPTARGYVQSHMPAYTRDGLTAFVSFAFGPTPHGAGGWYLLKKVNGRWKIVEREIGYYS